MKVIPSILLLVSLLSILGCRTKIVCGFPGTFEGEGLESELLRYESVGRMDTVLAQVKSKVTYAIIQEEKRVEKNGIGVNVLVKDPDGGEMLIGGITDRDGAFNTFLAAGIYDIEFSYSGCNSLVLRNVKLGSGEIKATDIRLGIQGKESKNYETNLKEK